MKEFISLTISKHAIERYRERIGPLSEGDFEAMVEMFGKLMSAKPKHLDRLKAVKDRRTTVIPVEDCFFIASFGTIVTVLDRTMLQGNRLAASAHAEDVAA